MKKLPHLFFSLLIIAPLLVSADSYDGPYCYEDPKLNEQEYVGDSYGPAGIGIRGTCKLVEISNTVSIDKKIASDYFLGSHEPIGFGCYKGYCETYSKYSEIVSITSSTTLPSSYSSGTNEVPYEYAVFDKKFFTEKLTTAQKNTKSNFSLSKFNNININIFQNEDDLKKGDYQASSYYAENEGSTQQMDTLYDHGNYGDNDAEYRLYTYNYKEYGKHIYAPKGDLLESQYVEVNTPIKLLSNEDLGITNGTVSPTNPLNSIINYWLYTKINNNLVLAWQKTEYTLDDGTVKTITKDDKNVTVAMILGTKSQTVQTSTTTSSKVAESAQNSKTTEKHTKVIPVSPSEPQEKGLFQRIINFFASLFI